MALKQYLIRLEEWQITELERRAGKNPVAPLIRSIIGDWLGLDDTAQKEQVMIEIEGLTGQLNILNQKLEDIESNEVKQHDMVAIESSRREYLESHQNVLDTYRNNSISSAGYRILLESLGFKNKGEVNAWLDEQTK